MIKFKKKQSTLYGFEMLVGALINLNLYILLKIIDVKNRKMLKMANSLNFTLLLIEIFLIFSIIRMEISFNIYYIVSIFLFSLLLFILCRSHLPYWEDIKDK